MESINIKQLIEASLEGDAASFEQLYNHFSDQLFSYISFRTATRDEALDVMQDSFVELYKALKNFSYQSDLAFYAFVFTIVRRQLAGHYKRRAKHQVQPLSEEVVAASPVDGESIHGLQVALSKLDEVSREIIVLHHWSRYTFGEIGAIINMKESAVRVRHHRAQATLASLLTR